MVAIQRLQPQDDFSDLIALSRAFFAEYQVHHEDFFKIDGLRDSDIVDYFSRSLDTDDGATFVAVLDGRMVGYITIFVRRQPSFYRIKQLGTISGLMVHTDHRRQGIASRLLAAATAFFRQQGIYYFTVYTAATNQGAVRFYERNGLTSLYVTLLGETTSSSEAA